MRIDLVGPVPPSHGGISVYTARLYAELRRRHDVRLICFRHLYPRFLYPGRHDRKGADEPSPEGALPLLDGRNPLSWLHVARCIRRRRPEWLILSWWVVYWVPLYWLLLGAARAAGSRVLFLCHNVEEHESNGWKRWLTRGILLRGDALLVHTVDERERLKVLVGDKRVAVVPLPSYEGLHVRLPDKAEARRRLTLGADEKIVLFFGFVRPYKGLQVLLRAMPLVLRRLPVRLLVAGEFWEKRGPYDRLIADLGLQAAVNVDDRYIPDEEMADYFQAADVVVLPYTAVTGSAIASLAIGFHKPIVASAIGALKEVVIPGEMGLLVPPGDAVALAAALIEFFTCFGERESEIRNYAMELNRRLSWSSLVEAIEELTAQVAGAAP